MEKVNLPTKTKIAAWWMIGIGGALTVLFWPEFISDVGFFGILGALLFIIPGYLLLKRKKSGWWLALTIVSINLVIFSWLVVPDILSPPGHPDLYVPEQLLFLVSILIIVSPLSIFRGAFLGSFTTGFLFLLLLIPLILLFLDRKNFWKVAS